MASHLFRSVFACLTIEAERMGNLATEKMVLFPKNTDPPLFTLFLNYLFPYRITTSLSTKQMLADGRE